MTAQADSASSFPDRRPDDLQWRRELRRELRLRRRSIPSQQRRLCAQQVATHLERAGFLTPRKRLGIYLALPEELSLTPVIQRAWSNHCLLFAPHITHPRLRRMRFFPYASHAELQPHHWNIATLGDIARLKAADTRSLDALLVPLVGFDAAGHRLGMGAGFYDRHCAWRGRDTNAGRPLLVGVAFAIQEVAQLPHADHDIALDAVVTEHGFHRFEKRG